MIEKIRIMRLLVYEGDQEMIRECLYSHNTVPAEGIKIINGKLKIKSALIDKFPELIMTSEEKIERMENDIHDLLQYIAFLSAEEGYNHEDIEKEIHDIADKYNKKLCDLWPKENETYEEIVTKSQDLKYTCQECNLIFITPKKTVNHALQDYIHVCPRCESENYTKSGYQKG